MEPCTAPQVSGAVRLLLGAWITLAPSGDLGCAFRHTQPHQPPDQAARQALSICSKRKAEHRRNDQTERCISGLKEKGERARQERTKCGPAG